MITIREWARLHRPELTRAAWGVAMVITGAIGARYAYREAIAGGDIWWSVVAVADAGVAILGAILVISGVFLQPEDMTNGEVRRLLSRGEHPTATDEPDVVP